MISRFRFSLAQLLLFFLLMGLVLTFILNAMHRISGNNCDLRLFNNSDHTIDNVHFSVLWLGNNAPFKHKEATSLRQTECLDLIVPAKEKYKISIDFVLSEKSISYEFETEMLRAGDEVKCEVTPKGEVYTSVGKAIK